MFTGIIESIGKVEALRKEGSNIHFTVSSLISCELRIDQSLAHDGVCLTVTGLESGSHTVTAVEETLLRSNLDGWQPGSLVNLERAMLANARLDGHLVQGHVDTTGTCIEVEYVEGSWRFYFEYEFSLDRLLVDKGSICINGVSLTVVRPEVLLEEKVGLFSVAIIPYTFEHTGFARMQVGDKVNLEFDVVGKYVAKFMALVRQ